MDAQLNDSPAAKGVMLALPITASANTWGDEIYFGIPVTTDVEDSQDVVELGDLAYWPPGRAFCIFFGLTPASRGGEIRAASAVAVIGRVLGDPSLFRNVHAGDQILLEVASE
jgi:hypothetical protein